MVIFFENDYALYSFQSILYLNIRRVNPQTQNFHPPP